MIERNAYDMEKICGGKLYNAGNDIYVNKVVLNDKEIVENCLFVAVKGAYHDGNDYAEKAIKNGAALILSENDPGTPLPVLKVDNVTDALIKLSHFYRKKERDSVIMVTGSVGKTTVKELIWSIASTEKDVLKSEGNKNNLLGLPLTLLSDNDTRTVVVEAGISEKGEMERLSYACSPDIVVITSVGINHSATLGTIDEIANEKLKSLKYAQGGAECIIPYGDDKLKVEGAITVSHDCDQADIYAKNIILTDQGCRFDAVLYQKKLYKDLFVPVVGTIGVADALFAVAVADLLGISEHGIRQGLSLYKSVSLRQNIITENGVTVMLDCYNSSPLSLCASLDAFELLKNGRTLTKSCLILGSMLELGESSQTEHFRIGKKIAESGCNLLVTYGEEAKNFALGALCAGFNGMVASFSESEAEGLRAFLRTLDLKDHAVLIKGSRRLGMEKLLSYVTEGKE